jgi:hypothetical protein
MSTKIYKIPFADIYPLYEQKVAKKGRTVEELNEIIFWLTGYDEQTLKKHIDNKSDMSTFFIQAPQINPNAIKITGVI